MKSQEATRYGGNETRTAAPQNGEKQTRTGAGARQAALERARVEKAGAANRERRRGGRDRHGGGHDRGDAVGEQVGAHLARARVARVLRRMKDVCICVTKSTCRSCHI